MNRHIANFILNDAGFYGKRRRCNAVLDYGGRTVFRPKTGLMETLNSQTVGKGIIPLPKRHIPFTKNVRTFCLKCIYLFDERYGRFAGKLLRF